MKLPNKTRIGISIAVALFMCHIQYPAWAGDLQSYEKVHAFYYPWYGNPQTDKFHYHWSHQQFVKEGEPKNYPGGDDVAASFYPKLGCYSSNSDQDLNAHMLMLRRAKVGVICSSWWGKDSYTDKAVPRLLDAAARHNIKVCFHIEPFPGRNAQSTKYMIVVTGGELLRGAYPDGHTFFLTRTLRPLGLECIGSIIVDDKQADVKEALRYATNKAGLVIVTGGLGPTDNDITRETLSDFTGITLKEHPDVLQEMARRFRVPPDELRANLRRQTQVPTEGTYMRNTEGTAVGLVFEQDKRVIVALPGPPRELQAMVRNELVPYLSKRFGTRLPGSSLTLRFVGLGQSQIDQSLKDNVPLAPDITVSSQFEGGRVDFTFSLPEDTPQDRARLSELKQEIMKHLGEYIYADDETSLEEHVLGLLKARGQTLALAEVGSGGSLAAALSGADADGQVLAGAFVAPSIEKLRRLLTIDNEDRTGSESDGQKIKQLAAATANATASQWVVVVGEVRRDKSGSGYVEVAFKLPDESIESRKVRLSGAGEIARSRLSTQLLDQLRRRLK